MKVALQVLFSGREQDPDAEMYQEEIALAIEAESLGFDRVQVVEHHFTDYAMCPDNAQVLSYIAARTESIELMPAAFILPWNDPLRVVEKTILLDHLSGGRAVLGLGRGLARREFEAFRTDMSEARGRFDEAAPMILRALEEGWIEGDGPFYPQPRVEMRPRPLKSFAGRSIMVGGSPDSLLTAARCGTQVMQFSTSPTPEAAAGLGPYRDLFAELHDRPAPPVLTADLMLCDSSRDRAGELARQYMPDYWFSVMGHYELLSGHFAEQNGTYDTYAAMSEQLRNDKDNLAAAAYVDNNLWGDPDHILEQLQVKHDLFGGIDLAVVASYADMPYDLVRSSLRLFAKEVLPVVQSWPEAPAQPVMSAASSATD